MGPVTFSPRRDEIERLRVAENAARGTHRLPLPSTYAMRFSSSGDHEYVWPSYGG